MPYKELTDWFVIIEMKGFESVVSAVSLNETDYVSYFKAKIAGRNLT
jgi:hypothetical protein